VASSNAVAESDEFDIGVLPVRIQTVWSGTVFYISSPLPPLNSNLGVISQWVAGYIQGSNSLGRYGWGLHQDMLQVPRNSTQMSKDPEGWLRTSLYCASEDAE